MAATDFIIQNGGNGTLVMREGVDLGWQEVHSGKPLEEYLANE